MDLMRKSILKLILIALATPILFSGTFSGCLGEDGGKSSAGTDVNSSSNDESLSEVQVEKEKYEPSSYLEGTLAVDMTKTVNGNIIGNGFNFNYSAVVDRSQYFPFMPFAPEEVEKKEWEQFLKMTDYTGANYVRLMVDYTMWEPVNDNEDPNVTDFESGYSFSPKIKDRVNTIPEITYQYMQRFYTLLDYFEKSGTFVVLANWGRGSLCFNPDGTPWLIEKKPDGSYYGWCGDDGFHVTDINEFTESLAAVMYHLIEEKKYTCVKGISIWNEPESFKSYNETIAKAYNSLGAQLNRLGIRDKVLVQGFDGCLFYNADEGWDHNRLSKVLDLCGENVDIISLHEYWSSMEFERDMPNAGDTITQGQNEKFLFPALRQKNTGGRERMVIFGEKGSFAYGGNVEATPKDFRLRLNYAEAMTMSYNEGVKAIGGWIYNFPAHTHYTMLKESRDHLMRLEPDSHNFYPMSLMTKYIKQGSNIVESTMAGCKDSLAQRVFASVAVKGENITILMVNDSDEPAKVTIKGINKSKTYNYVYVADGRHDKLYINEDYMPVSNESVFIRPKSIIVLTTYAPGPVKFEFDE